MHRQQQGLVDVLEIYHARQLRDQLLANLRRLRQGANDPHRSPASRQEIRSYYEAMLLLAAEMLRGLGDEGPLIPAQDG